METYLSAGIAFILLLPIFFLFRQKFTTKGKWGIPSIAFIVSLAGIYVYDTLTIWHSIILMVLLLLLSAIFLKRIPFFSL